MSKTHGWRFDPWEVAILIAVLVVCLMILIPVVFAEPVKPPARPPLGLSLPCEIIEVYDGDTLTTRVTFDCRVRLLDCWAPEVRTKHEREKQAGLASRDHLRGLCATADGTPRQGMLVIPLDEVTRFDDAITLGRVLGYVWLDPADDLPQQQTQVDLSTLQVEQGHAWRRKDELTQALGL